MGKKPPARAKPKAKAEAEPDPPEEESAEQLEKKRLWQQRREATKWTQAQLTVVRGQLEAAKSKGSGDWLQVAHEFHEIRLIKLAKRLEEKTLDALPQELRDGVEAYLAQCIGGPAADKDGFKTVQDVWDHLEAEGGEAYKRPPESPEAAAAAEKLKVWSDASASGVAEMAALMKSQGDSASVQEAGLTRVGGLFSEAREQAEPTSAMAGLTVALLMPAVEAAMRGHPADAEVQRRGCAALRGIAMAPGQLGFMCDAGGVQLAVEAVRTHFKQKEVVMAANGAFWEMAKVAGKNSPELGKMRTADVPGALLKCMDHHAWDQTLCGKIRVVLPFITED